MFAMNQEIDHYESAVATLRAAVAGLSRVQLRAHPIPGTWSLHQIAVHLTDCEQVFGDRIKRVVAESNPPLMSFDENLWMQNLAIDSRPTEESLDLLDLNRRQIARILRELPPTAFARTGIHSEIGSMSLSEILAKANWHFEHHMKFVHQKRSLVLNNT